MIPELGHVYLVGAGPGDPDLITVRGLRMISNADVVIHDRLISLELLKECHADATVIDVGKYPDHHRISQAEINALLVYHAKQNRAVVRLKGGDPFVFGRGTEEVEACRNEGVPCHIVPGISSAIAGPAAAGIPVTSRGIARSWMVVTGQTAPELASNSINFQAMAATDTIVLMMARKNLRHIAERLIRAGRVASTPVACIERATCKDQRVTCGSLDNIADLVDDLKLSNPMITIIGEVASMADPNLIELPAEIEEDFYAFEFGE